MFCDNAGTSLRSLPAYILASFENQQTVRAGNSMYYRRLTELSQVLHSAGGPRLPDVGLLIQMIPFFVWMDPHYTPLLNYNSR